MEENILVPMLDFFLDQENVSNPRANGSDRKEGAVFGRKADLTMHYLNGVGEITGHIGDNQIHISYNSFINRFSFKLSIDGGQPVITDKNDILLITRDYLINSDEVPENKRPDLPGNLGAERPDC